MMHLQNPLKTAVFTESWNEELARTKRYNDAAQKRSKEKAVRREMEKVKKASQVGRLNIEL